MHYHGLSDPNPIARCSQPCSKLVPRFLQLPFHMHIHNKNRMKANTKIHHHKFYSTLERQLTISAKSFTILTQKTATLRNEFIQCYMITTLII